jgi:Toxin SymE, type I toxin-antitoxin system
MCGRSGNCSSLPEPSGPTDERFVYHLTEEGRRVLAAHDRAAGGSSHCRMRRTAAVAAALEREARRERGRARRRAARDAGLRSGTVCGRWQGRARVPDLRLSGHWLRQAGFDLGQGYEIEVQAGRLTIQAV